MFLIRSLIILSFYASLSYARTLTEGQVEFIKKRSFLNDGFIVRVLEGEIDHSPKTVVLFGETHIKTTSSAKKARQLVDSFDFYGIEGLDSSKYWGEGKGFEKFLSLFYFFLGKALDGSSIDNAYENDERGFEKARLCSTIEREYLNGRFRSFEELIEINENLGKNAIPQSLLKRIYATIVDKKECEQAFEKAVFLEAGYNPKIQDNLAVFLYPIFISMALIQKCTSVACHRWPQTRFLSVVNKAPIPILKILSDYLVTDIGMRLLWGDNEILDKVFIFSTGFFYNRNKNMAENIVKGFEDNPERENMLVMMGMAHLNSVKSLLQKKYGFHEVQF